MKTVDRYFEITAGSLLSYVDCEYHHVMSEVELYANST